MCLVVLSPRYTSGGFFCEFQDTENIQEKMSGLLDEDRPIPLVAALLAPINKGHNALLSAETLLTPAPTTVGLSKLPNDVSICFPGTPVPP
ncbi:hypothetical protein K435DRAFT_244762 [Dendrothele bispora CBS 962.96]|uniref:Uncharacterized protein n=1 Tax=Dendrothele bispora (strain CBS 962.96) TaxID=1314807 RepID=A0A4S8L0E8_DENBC|nr:hypothetical protein K435DRAFT_469556 [Dendrothele bispora CBS 962.96]THU91000.1 hypothetical protein K435DRAFT_244762 [Dendrothele bispora CBS 962.96]